MILPATTKSCSPLSHSEWESINGVARIKGDAEDDAGINVWGGVEPEHPAQFDGKSYGLLGVDGVLSMWVSAQPARHLQSSALARYVDSYLIEPTWGPDRMPQTVHGFDVHKPAGGPAIQGPDHP